MDIGHITDIGNVRKENQDRFLALYRQEDGKEAFLCAVADGMGGTERGSLASEHVIGRLREWWMREFPCRLKERDVFVSLSADLDRLLQSCGSQIYRLAGTEHISTGTTLSLLCAYGGWGIVKHIGDSRIYMKRGRKWSQLTRDHTWEQYEMDRGRRPEEDAGYQRNRGKLVNAMGVGDSCYIETKIVQMAPEDRYLLCSDGIYRYLDPLYDMEELERDCQDAQTLLDRISARILRTDAMDNFTAVLADVMDR